MTGIIDEVLSTLDMDAPVRDVRLGLFHSGVQTRHCGLASTLSKDILKQEKPWLADPGFLLEKSAEELARMSLSPKLMEAVVGMAAVNSLLDTDLGNARRLNARELIAEKGRNGSVAIVGHFPFVEDLRKGVKELWVIEKNPTDGDLGEKAAGEWIPRADVVGISGTAFTNHTIDALLEMCREDAFVVVLGDSAPLSPVLLDCGIDAVSGTRVLDPDLALRCVSQGANYRQIKGIEQITLIRQA